MEIRRKIEGLISTIQENNKIKSGKIDNIFIPEIVFDSLFYFQHIRTRQLADCYDIAILAILDYFICYHMQKNDKLKLFYNIPKIFMLSLTAPLFLNIITLFRIGLHLKSNPSNNIYFMFSAAFSIFFSSFSGSRTLACILTTIVMTFAINVWDDISGENTYCSELGNALTSNFGTIETTKALASELINKLKKLKFKMLCEKEYLIKVNKPMMVSSMK
jgi:hypothetical protein